MDEDMSDTVQKYKNRRAERGITYSPDMYHDSFGLGGQRLNLVHQGDDQSIESLEGDLDVGTIHNPYGYVPAKEEKQIEQSGRSLWQHRTKV